MLYNAKTGSEQAKLAAISKAVSDHNASMEDIFRAIEWRWDIRYVPEVGIIWGKYYHTVLNTPADQKYGKNHAEEPQATKAQ